MFIKLKGNVAPEPMNTLLEEKYGISSRFITEASISRLIDEINTNHDCKHLRPEGKKATRADLEAMFPTWTEVGLFDADLYFERTSTEEMKRIADFIIDNADKIEYITDVETLIDRGEIHSLYTGILLNLEKKEEEPEQLPKEKQTINDLQSGLLLCKTWSPDPVWVVFGSVDEPKFLKDKIYADDMLNNIYRDKNEIAYLLIPLNDMSAGFAEKVTAGMWNMGIREHPYFLLTYLYGYDISDLPSVAAGFAEFYNKKELIERFHTVTDKLKGLSRDLKIIVEGQKIRYISSTAGLSLFKGCENISNCFIMAMNKHFGRLKELKNNSLVFERGAIQLEDKSRKDRDKVA